MDTTLIHERVTAIRKVVSDALIHFDTWLDDRTNEKAVLKSFAKMDRTMVELDMLLNELENADARQTQIDS